MKVEMKEIDLPMFNRLDQVFNISHNLEEDEKQVVFLESCKIVESEIQKILGKEIEINPRDNYKVNMMVSKSVFLNVRAVILSSMEKFKRFFVLNGFDFDLLGKLEDIEKCFSIFLHFVLEFHDFYEYDLFEKLKETLGNFKDDTMSFTINLN